MATGPVVFYRWADGSDAKAGQFFRSGTRDRLHVRRPDEAGGVQ